MPIGYRLYSYSLYGHALRLQGLAGPGRAQVLRHTALAGPATGVSLAGRARQEIAAVAAGAMIFRLTRRAPELNSRTWRSRTALQVLHCAPAPVEQDTICRTCLRSLLN